MASILGASLSELLRHGSRFGLGVQEAGRQNQAAQQQTDAAMEKARREQILAQALLEQRNSSTALNRGRLKDLGTKLPKAPTETMVEGQLGNILAQNPGAPDQQILDTTLGQYRDTQGEVARAVLNKIRRQQESDRRSNEASARSAERSGGTDRIVSQGKGYAEDLAIQLSRQYDQVLKNPHGRGSVEKWAATQVRLKYPELGEDEVGAMVRRAFRDVLEGVPVISADGLAALSRLGGGTPPAPGG